MRSCPKCKSIQLNKELWHQVVPNAFAIGGGDAHGQAGDLVCDLCGFRGLRTALTTQLRQKNKMNKFIS